jgi:hypothetical protein
MHDNNNVFGVLDLNTTSENYYSEHERSDELGAVMHAHAKGGTEDTMVSREYGGFFDARIFGGAGWGEKEVGQEHKGQVWTGTEWVSAVSADGVAASAQRQSATSGTTAQPAAPTAPVAPAARRGRYPDLAEGKWTMAPGNTARIIRDRWVYAQWPDNAVSVLENEKGEEVRTDYAKDSTAAKNILLHYGPFETPKTQPTAAPQAAAAGSASADRGAGFNNFIAAVLPAVLQIWGPKEEPAAPTTTESSSGAGTMIVVGVGALALIGGAFFLLRSRNAPQQE